MILEHVMIVVMQTVTNEMMIMHRYGYYSEYYNRHQAYCMFGFRLRCNLADFSAILLTSVPYQEYAILGNNK